MSALAKSQKKKAEEFANAAQILVNKKAGWFGNSKEKNLEEAAENYQLAANAYKVGGFAQEAGNMYVESAKLHDSLKNTSEAAKAYSQAGNSFKKSSPIDAVTSYQSAVTYLVDAGRLTQAAKLCKEIAELYETEQMEDEKSFVVHAIESYEQASELFQLEDSKSQSNHCQAKIAELCSAVLDPPDLTRAAHLYKDLGENSLSSNLLKFNAKSHFLNSILCHLAAGDAVAAESDLQQYESLDYTFGESREGKFATNLVESVVNTDVESFSNLCFEYDRISKLDPWKTSMLVKVKRSMEDGEDEDDVDLT